MRPEALFLLILVWPLALGWTIDALLYLEALIAGWKLDGGR